MKNLKQKEKKHINCSICGKFMGFKNWENKEVDVCYVPDSEVTIEETVFTHKKCKTYDLGKFQTSLS